MSTRSLSPERLKVAREAAGLNQRDAATAVGVSRATIQNAEAGTSTPRADALGRMADAYGVSVDSLFAHDPEAVRPATGCGTNQPHTDDSPVAAGVGPSPEG